MHERMGIGRIGSKKNRIFQGAWVRSVFKPYGTFKESSNETSNFGHAISSKWWMRVACQLKSLYSKDILPQWSRAQGFKNIPGSKCCWCQIPKSKKFRRTWKNTLDFDKSYKARGVRRVWSVQFLKVQGTAKFKIAPKGLRRCISAIACHGPLWTTHALPSQRG